MEVRNPADLLDEVDRLRAAVFMKAETIARDWDGWIERPDFAPSAANFAHYLALRCHDIRPLQLELTARGLSSLGRAESRVLPTLDAVAAVLAVLAGKATTAPDPDQAFFSGEERLVSRRGDNADLSMPRVFDDPVAEPRGAAGGRRSNISSSDVAVWRRVSCWPLTLPRGCRRVAASVVLVAHAAARWPVVAGARRRRRGADPRHRQHRPFATNKRSTSAAARRPPTAAQSAAQARRAARAPRRSISHAHRSPQARAGQSERCHKPPQRSCLNRGAVAHHRRARAAPPAPSS